MVLFQGIGESIESCKVSFGLMGIENFAAMNGFLKWKIHSSEGESSP